ncbi:transposase zinc-binding domain-containing protein [Paraburkholderia atlantica]|uniref:transposase zinc-binding domain-containing protein n=1 Tax=Paraburkholderia atlantica TaxID=2654982 RepID=UPI000A0107BF
MHEHEIRSAVVDNVVRLLACGLEVMGYASHCCSNGACPHRKKVCFSCKSRFCPTCGKKATDQWIATQTARPPQTRWQHIRLTMPSALGEVFRLNRALLKAPSPQTELHPKSWTRIQPWGCFSRRCTRSGATCNGTCMSI